MGIGRATAHAFALAGARAIYICDLHPTNLSAISSELFNLGGRSPDLEVHVRAFDVAESVSVREVIHHAIDTYGHLDVFFANAGIATALPLPRITEDAFMQTLRTNVLSTFLAIKCAAPALQISHSSKPGQGGSIIATASVAALRSNAGSSDYSASKAAVVSLVQTSAYQLAGTGVRVNAICPGLIETGMTSLMFEQARSKGTEGKIGQLNPMQRAGCADEVARVAVTLAGMEGSYVNGQAWAVDGGLSAGLPFVKGKMA